MYRSSFQLPENPTFKDMFMAFSYFGDPRSNGMQISLSQSDKWMKQSRVIDNKRLTTTDTAICFKKLKALKINHNDYIHFLQDLCCSKGIDLEEVITNMTNCGAPGVYFNSRKSNDVYGRLTDVSKYTGAHKKRFDESGKGKGIEGRENATSDTGYVTGYHNMGTYDDKKQNN